MFDKIRAVCTYIASLTEEGVLDDAYQDTKILDFVEEANTQDQLFQGIDATGTTLKSIGGGYSPLTILIKTRKGQPTNRVTLKDTGAFYKSIRAMAVGNGDLEIDANYMKQGTDLRTRWGKNLLGLTQLKKDELVKKLIPTIQNNIRDDINAL